MTRKRGILLFFLALLAFGYYKLFYKTYTNTSVTKSADCVVAIDVKRIATTAIWQLITTPSQWKIGSSSSTKDTSVSWKDIIKIPDYIFVFHTKNQPSGIWFTALQIKDSVAFNKAVVQYHFKQINNQLFICDSLNIAFVKYENNILLANIKLADTANLLTIANELFYRKEFIAKEQLAKNISASSHVSVQVLANNFLQDDAIVKVNFDKEKIQIQSTLNPKKEYSFSESNFTYNSNSLLSLCFAQPSPSVTNLLSDAVKQKISTALNFNINEFVDLKNAQYNLDIDGIKPRVDSAISFTYDDNFNEIKKVVVNNVEEPAFKFSVKANDVNNLYLSFEKEKKLETTAAGNLFTPMPFVKSYCTKLSNQLLTISANNYQQTIQDKSVNSILFLHSNLSKIPSSVLKYLPTAVLNALQNLDVVEINATTKNSKIFVNATLNKNSKTPLLVKF